MQGFTAQYDTSWLIFSQRAILLIFLFLARTSDSFPINTQSFPSDSRGGDRSIHFAGGHVSPTTFETLLSDMRKAAGSDEEIKDKQGDAPGSSDQNSSNANSGGESGPDESADGEYIAGVADTGPKPAPTGLQYMPRVVVCVLFGLLFVVIVVSVIGRWIVLKRRPSLVPGMLQGTSQKSIDVENHVTEKDNTGNRLVPAATSSSVI